MKPKKIRKILRIVFTHSCSFIAYLDSISLPNNVPKALSHPGWRSAMIEEINALNDNDT